MNVNLTEDQIKKIKGCLSGICDVKAEIKELTESLSDYKKEIADVLECKPGKVSGIIKGYLQKYDGLEPDCYNDSLVLEKICGVSSEEEDDEDE